MASFIDVKVSDEIVKLFSEMQLKKDKQYIILKLSKKMDAVEVHCSGGKVDLAQDQKAAFDEFKVLLDNTECRFAIYDFRFSVAAGERQKLIFIAWWVSLKCILGWLGRVDRWMKCRLMWSYRDHCMSYLLSNVEIPMLCDGKVTFMNHCRSRVNYNWLDAVFVIKSTQGQLL